MERARRWLWYLIFVGWAAWHVRTYTAGYRWTQFKRIIEMRKEHTCEQ